VHSKAQISLSSGCVTHWCLVERGRGRRASFIPDNEDTSFARVEVIRAERFAAARAAELEEACAALPPRIAPAASRLSDVGAPPARMRLRRRAASYRPYKMPLSVRLNPRKKRRLSSGMVVRVLCRACRRAVRSLAAKQQADAGDQAAVRASSTTPAARHRYALDYGTASCARLLVKSAPDIG